MTEDFVTQLRLQLREAALREERRAPVARQAVRARRRLPGPAPMAAALAMALLALAVALGAAALRDDPEPARPRVIATFSLASGLSPLAPGFGAVWTADPIRGEILRIDPATRRVAKRIAVDGDARVATGAGAVWALAGDLLYAGDDAPVRLLRIDPETNRVVARIAMRTPAGKPFAPLELQIDGNVVWVVGVDGALRIDPGSNVPDRYVPLTAESGGTTRGVVTAGDSVWVLTVDGRLRRFDARTRRVVREVRVAAPARSRLTWGRPGTLTLTSTNEIAALNRATGRPLWRATLPGDIRFWIADGDALWAHVAREPAHPDLLVRLDADSGRRLGQAGLPEAGVAGMAKVGRDLWIATPGGRIVIVR